MCEHLLKKGAESSPLDRYAQYAAGSSRGTSGMMLSRCRRKHDAFKVGDTTTINAAVVPKAPAAPGRGGVRKFGGLSDVGRRWGEMRPGRSSTSERHCISRRSTAI